MGKKLILNRMRTPDGTVLTSYHVHDFKVHTDANGKQYGVDGGSQYVRRIGDTRECEDLCVWVDEEDINGEFDTIREHLHWGTRGKNGDQPLRWVSLKDIADDHLEAILEYSKTRNVNGFYIRCLSKENRLRKRK